MLQRLPKSPAQVQLFNTSENLGNWNLSNHIFFVSEAYNKIINSINPKNRKDTIVKDSENSKRSHHNRLFLNLTRKINLKRSDNYFALSNLSLYYT